ncbi:MAG: Transcriptional regulator, Fur family, partial [uncultured Frankineae bacterium]
ARRARLRLPPGGVRRAARVDRSGPGAAHPAGWLARPLRGAGRGQPPPRGVPHLRSGAGRRLRRRRRPLPHRLRRRRLPHRRGRGRLLGALPYLLVRHSRL